MMKTVLGFAWVLWIAYSNASAAVISIVPSAYVSDGSPISLDVNVSGVSDLFAFQFDIAFDPAILAATGATEGPLFSGVGVSFSPGVIDNTAGTISFIGDSLSGPGPGISGSGTLAEIHFQPVGIGSSAVGLSNVILLDSALGDIAATVDNATVSVTALVPEPATFMLISVALGVLGAARYRARRHPE